MELMTYSWMLVGFLLVSTRFSDALPNRLEKRETTLDGFLSERIQSWQDLLTAMLRKTVPDKELSGNRNIRHDQMDRPLRRPNIKNKQNEPLRVPSRYEDEVVFDAGSVKYDEDIVYENPSHNNNDTDLPSGPVFNVSECNGTELYCEEVDGYPSDAIALMVRDQANMLTDIFGVYEEMRSQVVQKNAPASFASPQFSPSSSDEKTMAPVLRVKPVPQSDDISLCESRTGFIFPKKAKTVTNQWVLVVNQDNMTQGVWTEKCLNENDKCAYSDSFPIGFKSFCKQKYSEYKLLSVNEVDGKMGIQTFRFPTCCACHLKSTMTLKADVAPVPQDRTLRIRSSHMTLPQD